MRTGSKARPQKHCLGKQGYCQESQSSGKVEIAKGLQEQQDEVLYGQIYKENKKGTCHHAAK